MEDTVKNFKWKRIAQDKAFLGMILAGIVVLTAITAGIVMRGSDAPDRTDLYAQKEESEQGTAMEESAGVPEPSWEADASLAPDATSDAEDPARPAGADRESVEASQAEESLPEASEDGATAVVLNFGETARMTWPVAGSVLLEYSMDHTVYHATLEQYKVSPGMLIQAEPGETVLAPAVGQVTEVGWNEEIGNYVVLHLGNGYEAVIGQLDGICVAQSQYVTAGTPLGAAAQPTKYYTVEGPHVYFRLNRDGVPVDPVDFLE